MSLRQMVLFVGHVELKYTFSKDSSTFRFLFGMGRFFEHNLKPKKILVISAHAGADPIRATTALHPHTVHDHPYSDFYGLRYASPGDPQFAERVLRMLSDKGFATQGDPDIGYDSGAWVAALPLFPKMDVPMVQLSLHASKDPQKHVEIGQALAPLRDEEVLILCSGSCVSNQVEFENAERAGQSLDAPPPWSREFFQWTSQQLSLVGDERTRALAAYRMHPVAHRAQPTGEHFLPLLVAAGAAGPDRGELIHSAYQHNYSTGTWSFEDVRK